MPTTSGTSAYAGLPWPGDVTVPDVPTDVHALASRLETIFVNVFGGTAAVAMPSAPITPGLLTAAASMSTFQSQLTTQGSTIATLQGQVATLQSQVTTLQGQMTAVQRPVWGGTAQDDTHRSYAKADLGALPVVLNTLAVPTQAYQQLVVVQGCGQWGLDPDTRWIPNSNNTWTPNASAYGMRLLADTGAGYASRQFAIAWEVDHFFSMTYMETIPASGHYSIRQTIESPEQWHHQDDTRLFNQDDDLPGVFTPSRIYATAIPWTGPAIPLPT